MEKTFLTHKSNLIIKSLAIFICIAFLMGIMPLSGISKLLLSASAATLEFDESMGSFSTTTDNSGNTVLTATPAENHGFRGWFSKNGDEVSIDPVFTITDGSDPDAYVPVFYNFNLVASGSFEEYASGTDMKSAALQGERWYGVCFPAGVPNESSAAESDWTSISIGNTRSKSGANSLELYARYRAAYRVFDGLESDTQYTLKFYYYQDDISAVTEDNQYLECAYIVGNDVEITYDAISYNSPFLAKYTGVATNKGSSGEWKEVVMTFNSGDNTSVKLALCYCSPNSTTSNGMTLLNKNNCLYIDDLSIIKDELAEPTYFNEDFTKSPLGNWHISDTKAVGFKRTAPYLEVEPKTAFGWVGTSGVALKKNAKYTISFDLDLSKVYHTYAPALDANGNIIYYTDGTTNSDGSNYQQDSNAPNWINVAISNTEGVYGSNNDSTLAVSGTTLGAVTWKAVDKNGKSWIISEDKKLGGLFTEKNKYSQYTAMGFSAVTGSGSLDRASLNISCTFTAPEDMVAYLNFRLNGQGNYTVDNIKIAEDVSAVDLKALAVKSAIDTKGTAIRTTKRQGMRYKTQIDKRLLTDKNDFGIRLTEYGTLAIKSSLLNDDELTLNTESVKIGTAYSFISHKDMIFYEDDSSIQFTGVLINIDETHWLDDYTVRTYFKYVDENNNEGVIYADPNDISVYPIARQAYSAKADGEYIENEEVREYLYEKILKKFNDKTVKVFNNQTPISTTYQGIRSTVYHGTVFFPDDHGRMYTDEQAMIEINRLKDTKVDNVRTRFASQWMWHEGAWNWNTTRMNAFYKWGNLLEDNGISITLNMGWHLHDFVYYYDKHFNNNAHAYDSTDTGHSSIPEVDYLHGVGSELYGEDTAYAAKIATAYNSLNRWAEDSALTESEIAHYSVAAARYGEWVKQALLNLKAHGVTNVDYILPFTETGYIYWDSKLGAYDDYYTLDEWIIMVLGMQIVLEENNLRKDYKIIGPSQALPAYQFTDWVTTDPRPVARRFSFIDYYLNAVEGTKYSNMVDILSSHHYSQSLPAYGNGEEESVYDVTGSFETSKEDFELYQREIEKHQTNSSATFWCDEYFAHAPDAKHWNGVGMQMVQFAAGLTAGINTCVDRFVTWQMFDTRWDSTATYGNAAVDNNGDYIGGIHAVGTCPALGTADGIACTIVDCECHNYDSISSYVPRTTYYGINLIGKYMNNKAATVYKTAVSNDADDFEGGLYVSTIKGDAGELVVLVVNTAATTTSIKVEFDKISEGTEFSRYLYNPEDIIPTADATSIPSDITISSTNIGFGDIIPSRSFAIYVAKNDGFIGEDNEVDFGDE